MHWIRFEVFNILTHSTERRPSSSSSSSPSSSLCLKIKIGTHLFAFYIFYILSIVLASIVCCSGTYFFHWYILARVCCRLFFIWFFFVEFIVNEKKYAREMQHSGYSLCFIFYLFIHGIESRWTNERNSSIWALKSHAIGTNKIKIQLIICTHTHTITKNSIRFFLIFFFSEKQSGLFTFWCFI